jgi:hypothetical protein
MKVAKTFAVLAAICLVGAIAVATLGPEDMTLGEGIAAMDIFQLASVEKFVRVHVSGWIWDHPFKALLDRPLWLLPASIGLLLAGACATAATSGNALNSRRRRS